MGLARIFSGGGDTYRKFSNKFIKKIAEKFIIFAYFPKYLTYHGIIFCAFGGKTQFVGNLQKDFLKKIAKMYYFSTFFKKFNKPWVNFLRVWTKNAMLEILRKFS